MLNLDLLHNKNMTGRGQGKTTRMIYDVMGQIELGNINDIVILINRHYDLHYMLDMFVDAFKHLGITFLWHNDRKCFIVGVKRVRFVCTQRYDEVQRKLRGSDPVIFDGRDYYVYGECDYFISQYLKGRWE